MPLKDHFLIEDYSMMVGEIDRLLNTFQRILRRAENADFYGKENELAMIDQSLKVLKALNAKKLNREQRTIDAHMRGFLK